jgi:transposase
MLKVTQVHVIRHKVLVEGLSQRRASREMGVSRNTVKKYIAVPEPVRTPGGPRRRPVLEQVRPRMDELIAEWRGRTTSKQRLTGTRLHRQLVEEGYQVGSTLVRAYLRELRRREAEVYIPLLHRPGDEAQVDFFEVTVDVGGVRRKAWQFLLRLMYSGRDFTWLYDRCDQLAFLDGHVRAFGHFGAAPVRCVYDNLSAAVSRRAFPGRRLTERFQALVSHYLFEACFARIGVGHDKGGVEGRGNAIRLQHLTPVPQGGSLEEISRALLHDIEQLAARKKDADGRTVMDRFEHELGAMLPLPPRPFEARRALPVSIRSTSTVRVEGAWYSVPGAWARLEATAHVGVDDVRIDCLGQTVTHPRQKPGGRSIRYRHYLGELARKPQAVRQVAPELVAELGRPFDLLWELLEGAYGPLEAARMFARVIGAINEHGEAVVHDAVRAALERGSADLLWLGPMIAEPRQPEVRVPETLAGYEIQSARAADYDAVLAGGRL